MKVLVAMGCGVGSARRSAQEWARVPSKIFWNDDGLEGTKGHFSN